MVYVRNRDAPAKEVKGAESVIDDMEPKLELDEFEDIEEIPLASASSSEHLSASFASVDHLALSQTRSFSMASDRGRTIPLNDSFSFGEPSRHDRSYLNSAAEYADDYPALRGPTTSGMVSPNEPMIICLTLLSLLPLQESTIAHFQCQCTTSPTTTLGAHHFAQTCTIRWNMGPLKPSHRTRCITHCR
jgi:hypothetical protein